MSTPSDRHGLEVLTLAECLSLLRSRPVGRLAYLEGGEPSVVPVNHLVDGSAVVIRSLAGPKLDAAVLNEPVAFQVDDFDAADRTGWSVLVRGTARLVEDPSDAARYATDLDSWAMVDPRWATFFRIDAHEVTGRRLGGDHAPPT